MIKADDITVSFLLRQMRRKSYIVFEDDTKPYNLNLAAIRTTENIPDAFNDWFILFWKYRGVWNILKHVCTTDAGLAYLGQTMGNPAGTAQVIPGQYIGLWEYDYHKGYRALRQKRPVDILRDFNRNGILDPAGGKVYRGVFGINHHRGKERGRTENIGPYSAGCIVTEDANEFNTEVKIYAQASELWGNSLSFTLFEEIELI